MSHHNRLQPLRAWRALRELLQDPERTELVFDITAALEGKSGIKNLKALKKSPSGQQIVADRVRWSQLLGERDTLRALPAATLGAHYAAFMDSEGLSADGLAEASEHTVDRRAAADATGIDAKELAWFDTHMRDQHDLWHVVTGYHRDTFGEACLLAFTVAQTGQLGLALIAFFGALKNGEAIGYRKALAGAWEGFRRGRKARWLPATDWRTELDRPIADVRADLRLTPTRHYRPLTTEDQSVTFGHSYSEFDGAQTG